MKKGFTLVELLAVIVILAFIALIATPTILNMVEDSRMSSVKISLDSLSRAVDLYYEEKVLNGTFSSIMFICKNNKCTNLSETEELKIETRGIESGTIDVDSDGIPTYRLVIFGHKCIGADNEVVCEPGRESIVKSDNVDDADVVITGLRNKILNNYRIYGSSSGVGDSTDNGYVIPVTVRGKNLIPFPYENTSTTKNGVTYTVNNDGSVQVSGTATANASFILYRNVMKLPKAIEIVNDYTLSQTYNKAAVSNISVTCNYYKIGTTSVSSYSSWLSASSTKITTKATPNDLQGLYCYLSVLSGKTVDGTVYPQLEKGLSATEYEPYVAPTTFNITLTSPLMKDDYIDFETQKVIRSNGTIESVELPAIYSLDLETTILEVNTINKPSNIEVTYIE